MDQRKKKPPKTNTTTTSPSPNLCSQLKDKAKHTAALIQEITEELQAIEEESTQEEQNLDTTQLSNLEQEDSDIPLTEDEQGLNTGNITEATSTYNESKGYKDIKSEHTEEVIIGIEQGTTFPTRIGTSICNALIDTGATKSCISEKYYQQLSAIPMQKLDHISVRSATGSNLTPLGIIHCSFELGKQDAKISEEQRQAFRDLCMEFNDIFSTDSGDIGKKHHC